MTVAWASLVGTEESSSPHAAGEGRVGAQGVCTSHLPGGENVL